MKSIFDTVPNTFLIGSAKCGTSSLAYMLAQHPQVFISQPKEPRFFSNDQKFSKGLDWLANTSYQGSEKYPIRLDATTAYSYWGEKVVKNLVQTYDKPEKLKFIEIYRDPVERAYSQYWMDLKLERENLSFEEAIQQETERLLANHEQFQILGDQRYGYVRAGSYASNLKPYLKAFSRDQFHFVIFDDFKDNPVETVQAIYDFLEIDEFQIQPMHKNRASLPRSKKIYQYLHEKNSPSKNLLKTIIPQNQRKKIKEFILSLVLNPINPSPLDQQFEIELRKRFTSEIKELEKILKRDLSDWL